MYSLLQACSYLYPYYVNVSILRYHPVLKCPLAPTAKIPMSTDLEVTTFGPWTTKQVEMEVMENVLNLVICLLSAC